MKRFAIGSALAVAMLATACGRTNETDTAANDSQTAPEIAAPAPGTDAGAAGAPSAGAQAFLAAAAESNQLEIEASRIAQERSDTAAVDAYAQTMVTDHTRSMTDMQQLVTSAGLTAPEMDPATVEAQVTILREASEEDFDQAYADLMVQSHERTVERFETYVSEGDNPQIQAWAEQTLPTLRTHLEEARALRQGLS